jgi:NAD(P)-dependent dehydrogenase (short-subunit alcohol dehydrogenase family)
MRFENKVIIITGASSGMGRETAILFSNEGAKVVLVARSEKGLDGTIDLCKNKDPNNFLKVVADLSDMKSPQIIIDETIKKFKQIDILFNNAGMGTQFQFLADFDPQTFDSIMNLNVKVVMLLTKLATEHLVKTKGNVINNSSMAAIKNFPFFVTYSMSKAALDKFTKCAALELGPKGVRVNSVNPGYIEGTDFIEKVGYSKEAAAALIQQGNFNDTPLGRVGTSRDVANAVAFLGKITFYSFLTNLKIIFNSILTIASDAASFLNGIILPVDGAVGRK